MGVVSRSSYPTAFVLGGISLFLTSCDRNPGDIPACNIDLGAAVGALEVALDTNFGPLEHWVHKSDYSCGKELVWGTPYSSWPFVKDTAYLTVHPDTFFHCMVRLFPNAPLDCDSALHAPQWLSQQVHGLEREYLTSGPDHVLVSHGIVATESVEWAYVQTHRSLPQQNARFVAYTEQNGHGIRLMWQRVARSPVQFEFNAYCRKQLETAQLVQGAH